MTETGDRRGAPRPSSVGALAHGGAAALWIVLAAWGGATPARATAQTPTDTIPADTISRDTIPPDTIPALPDTLPGLPDSLPDARAPDTVPAVENLPRVPGEAPAGFHTGVWEWDREALLANRALTLSELLEQIPGTVGLRGGDHGNPRSVAAFGIAGGGVRVVRDGVEQVPLSGSVPDLGRIGLGGLDRVRVERTGGGLRVELESVRQEDPRPYSLVEAGTGDLDTNLFRGAFLHPSALGGNVALALDRIDTRGSGGEQPGFNSAIWLRYSYLRGDRMGLVAEFSRASQARDTLYDPRETTRTGWTVRGRARLARGLVADAFWSRQSLDADTATGNGAFSFRAEPRSQLGARLSADRGPFFGRASLRSYSGEGLPDRRLEIRGGLRDPGLGGAIASWERESWSEGDAATIRLEAWTAPFHGVSLFGSLEEYERGVPWLPPLPPEEPGDEGGQDPTTGAAEPTDPVQPGAPPGARFTAGSARRVGARVRWRRLEVSGAHLVHEADTIHPLGLPMDRGGFVLSGGGERRGGEVAFRVPLLLDGLAAVGSGQIWERGDTARPHLPRRTWNAAVSFHDTFYPTGNLEIWADVGVQGRDAMTVPVPEPEPPAGAGGPIPATVPFYQSWYARLQIRVVTVRVFIAWENFTVRDVNQDFPGRILPATRALYGVRWTLWN